jgi:predicted flap endonuclease-1-like 5' DNA nuclease
MDRPGADQMPSVRRHVLDIEGISDHHAKRLRDLGIVTIGDLFRNDSSKVASHLEIPATVVDNWRAMGELIDVHGIGPQFAELLVRCDVKTIRQLATSDPEELLARVLLTGAERMLRVQGSPVGRRHVESWIDAARAHAASQNA